MSNSRKLILPPGVHTGRSHAQRVRNVETGRVLPCCYNDCERDGDARFRVEVPHNQPRWRDPLTGKQEMLVYIFCGTPHKLAFVKGTPYERYV